jgi:hypothetical protein
MLMGRANIHLREHVVNELYNLQKYFKRKKGIKKDYTDLLLQMIGIYMSELERDKE